MKKPLALLSVSAITVLTFSGLFSNTSYAATENSTTVNKNMGNSLRMHHTEMKYQVKSVMILNTKEIKLSGDTMEFINHSIRIQAEDGTCLFATYDQMKESFVINDNKSLIPGVMYRVSATWTHIPKKEGHIVIADLLKATQISPNKIELVFDRPVNMDSATKPGNYWVVSNQDKAADIANLGKNDMITPTNGLTAKQVNITPVEHSMTTFVMTFKENAMPGVQYTVIPCFVNVKGEMGYMGGNFNNSSMTTFVAKNFKS